MSRSLERWAAAVLGDRVPPSVAAIDYPCATQRPAEFAALLERLQALRPERICEIGTFRGGTLWSFSRVCADDGIVVTVTVDRSAPFYTRSLRRHVGRPGQTIASLEADSHAPATVERVKMLLGSQPLDFLFIDGDHSYAGVRRDFELYAPLVRAGGLIAPHDINAGTDSVREGESWAGDVPRFWSELRAGREVEELVAAPDRVGYGIGLVRV